MSLSLVIGIILFTMALCIYLMAKRLKKLGRAYDEATAQLLDIKAQFSAYSADSIKLSKLTGELKNETDKEISRVASSVDPVTQSIELLNNRKRKRKDT
jgi:uncharacterized protein YoxC